MVNPLKKLADGTKQSNAIAIGALILAGIAIILAVKKSGK